MGKKKEKKRLALMEVASRTPEVRAYADYEQSSGYSNTFAVSYDGEKNLGELGPIKRYMIDYDRLRDRSWQAYLDSEIAQIVINRFTTWVIGTGLKLQCQPQLQVLKGEKIEFEQEEFNLATEARFKLYSDSAMSAYSGMGSIQTIAEEAFINSRIGGDVLVVLRFVDNEIKADLYDGAHVCTPSNVSFSGSTYIYNETGNRVVNGIEINSRGMHVAYHVRTAIFEWTRIPARGEKTGHLMAYMVYGLKYRLNNVRGLPLIVAVMETVKKLERYKEATVGSAEERQKIPFFIEHGVQSTEENPLITRMAKAFNADKPGDNPIDVNGQKLADSVAVSMNKTVFNMPRDSKMVQLDSKNELSFGEFYMKNFDVICATVGIPPNVALSKYDDSFSASRAALKDWENTLIVQRKKFAQQFYQPIYNLWLHKEILMNKIYAPGYLTAAMQNNLMAIEAFRFARFTGANVPHIDPVKEVNAERLKLGSKYDSVPLTTAEAATEALNGGEFAANLQQCADEIGKSKEAGFEEEEAKPRVPETDGEDD